MILKGDCIEVMKAMKPNSMDAVVCDPPYGLEFMGKEWDKLSDDVVSKSWNTKGRSMTAKPKRQADSPGGRHATKTSPKPNPRCRKCGRVINGADTKKGFVVCHCEEPEIYMPNTYAVKMQLWHTQWLTEAYRVLKPGGSMLVMGGTRTSHRLACAIEDSGFIIKDTLMWLYGSGFPKAQDLGKMIDKRMGKKGKFIKENPNARPNSQPNYSLDGKSKNFSISVSPITEPTTNLAKHWDGFKVGGIKPAYEPIIWAVKPPEGSYVDNVLKYGVGAVNVDECRIGVNDNDHKGKGGGGVHEHWVGKDMENRIYGKIKRTDVDHNKGRFPANIILDEEAGRMLDEQSGNLKSGGGNKRNTEPNTFRAVIQHRNDNNIIGANSGGASRFFYCAKSSRSERNAGLKGITCTHPTVKPISLFEYLIKLVTRQGQIILDPFIGSGTTAIAAHNTGRKCVGIEKESEYLEIAKRRIDYWESQPKQMEIGA